MARSLYKEAIVYIARNEILGSWAKAGNTMMIPSTVQMTAKVFDRPVEQVKTDVVLAHAKLTGSVHKGAK